MRPQQGDAGGQAPGASVHQAVKPSGTDCASAPERQTGGRVAGTVAIDQENAFTSALPKTSIV